MAGKKCPECERRTLYTTGNIMKCNNPDCGLEVVIPPNGGKGGRGMRCPVCERLTVFNNVCTNCGAKFTMPKKK